MWVRSLGQKDPLEKEMVTLSSILAWEIPWAKEPGGLQPAESQRVRHDRTTTIILGMFWTGANTNRDQERFGAKQMSYIYPMFYAHSEQDEMSTKCVGCTWSTAGHSLLTSILKRFPRVMKSNKCY